MKTKHTPAPWNSTEFGDIEAKDTHICTVNQSMLGNKYPELTTHLEATANAKLIAAAPELLEALKLAYDLLEEHQDEAKWYLRGHYNKINAAIKKATE